MSLGGGGAVQTTPCLNFLKYCKNFNSAQNMLIYFRLHCLLYIFNRGGHASQANLLKNALATEYKHTEDYLKRKTIENYVSCFFLLAAMFLASNCTCTVYFTYTAHVPLLAKNMAATHVHAICTHICIHNQRNTLRLLLSRR